MPSKFCRHCKQSKLVQEFGLNRSRPDGLSSQCKECRNSHEREANRLRRATNPQWAESNRRYQREWIANKYQNNADFREKQKAEHREFMRTKRAIDSEWRENVNAKQRERQKRPDVAMRLREHRRLMYQTDAKTRLLRRASWHRRRVPRHSGGRVLSAQDVQRQHAAQKGKCYYCGHNLGKPYHVDHVIPLSRGGSNAPENLVLACPHCNLTKKDRLPHEWPEGGRLL